MHGQIFKETVGFGIRRGPMIRTAPGSAAFPAASCVHGTRHNGKPRCPGHTARHLERLALRDRRGSPGRYVHSQRTQTHPWSARPDARCGVPCRSTHGLPRLACWTRPAYVRNAIAAACGTVCVVASALERHDPNRASAVRGCRYDLQERQAEHSIGQGVDASVGTRGGQGDVSG